MFPFGSLEPDAYVREAEQKLMNFPEGWGDLSEDGKDFIKKLLVADPKVRLSADQALSHPWLSSLSPETPRKVNGVAGTPEVEIGKEVDMNSPDVSE